MTSAGSHEVLGDSIARGLSDKQYEKRKQVGRELEVKVREALTRSGGVGRQQVQRMLDCLCSDFMNSRQMGHQKGGLIGFASVALGCGSESSDLSYFLPQLLSPVLDLFQDGVVSRLKYLACEALYNIAKTGHALVLPHFNKIFDGLCKLYADTENEVRNAVAEVDRVMKDIVTQCGDKFDMDEFVRLLGANMPFRNPSVRQLMLSWISILLKVPEVQMASRVDKYLEGLFNMLGDQVRDVRHNADAVLNHLLMAVKSNNREDTLKIISGTACILVKSCSAPDSCARLTALCWLDEFVIFQMNGSTADQELTGNSLTEVKLAEVTERKRGSSQHQLSEGWMASLPGLVDGMLHCIDDHEKEIATMAIQLNSDLLDMVQTLEKDIPVDTLLDRMIKSMEERDSMAVRTACLQWVCMLLGHSPVQLLRRDTLQRLFDPIFHTLVLPDEDVVLAALQVLANIMSGRNADEDRLEAEDSSGDHFSAVTQRLLQLFAVERSILETRGRLMIRKLCTHLDPRQFYVVVAHAIKQEKDLELAKQLVQTFSWVLFTATETKSLREELLQTAPLDSSKGLFSELLVAWFHNPVSALALCLWAEQDNLALELTARLAAFDPTMDLFKQLDQLVQLLESPIFSRLRLRLLKPSRHPALVKCLLGLAMILPQAGAFNLLQERVHVLESGMLLEKRAARSPESSAGGDGLHAGGCGTDVASLLERFDARAQQRLQAGGGRGAGGPPSG